MEVNELVGAFEKSVGQDEQCNGKKSAPAGWKARINVWGTNKDCSGKRLYDRMSKDKNKSQGYLGPPEAFVAKPGVVAYPWDLNKITRAHFPVQAHHVIPKNHLPDHPVCTFLAKGYTKNKKYQLTDDTYYDTDHANNGYCMPYATPLAEWRRAGGDDEAKRCIAFEVMELSGRQLHQGSHRAGPYDDPLDAEEEADIHPGGYLDTIDQFLDVVQSGAQAHVDTCSVCKPDKSKRDIQPVDGVVHHVDQVSGLIKLLVDANRIFVSEPAHLWLSDRQTKISKPQWVKGK